MSYTAAKAVPSCFASKFDPLCEPLLKSIIDGDDSKQEWGGCTIAVEDLQDFIGAPQGSEIWSDSLVPYWYMDENCHYATPTADTQLCGFAGVTFSPISLFWEANTSLEEWTTVVPFSIDAKQPRAYSLWKASQKAPLLVFDPSHTGQITSATQLFGTYAFGGRLTKASYSSSTEVRTPWENGYDALALLDTNHDEKLSGKELGSLALWFDKNRDGASQPSEVKALSSLGVVAIYYKPDRTDPKSGDIQADLGYERLVNGKLVKGASVDWFSQTFSTRQEAMVALSAIFQQGKKPSDSLADELATRTAADRRDNPLQFHPHQATNHQEDLSGYWYWAVKENNGEKHPGIFAFEQVGAHALTGYSIVEAQLAENDKHLRSVVSALPATGTVSRDKDGRLRVAMKIIDRQSGGTARSTATLSEDGMTLSGKTTQLLVVEGDGKRRSATVDYEWVAWKFAGSAKAARK